MVIQSVVFKEDICGNPSLLFRDEGQVCYDFDCIRLTRGAWISTDSYMNLFDTVAWSSYTILDEFVCRLAVKGICNVELCRMTDAGTEVVATEGVSENDSESIVEFCIKYSGLYFVRITAVENTVIKAIEYMTRRQASDCKLALIMCTYKREEQLMSNLQVLRGSRFCDEQDLLFGKLKCYIVDNDAKLDKIDDRLVEVIHNVNSGGAGGFSRGIDAVRQNMASEGFTDVLFMDDDVLFLNESLYRIFALASYARDKSIPIAGRMFRLDSREVQYTACEIWNAGDIRHIGFNRDMTLADNIAYVNANAGEYAGWWLAAYSAQFVQKNAPMPVFLHCDDVEYGIRAGKEPFILNGIQVWHETYEYRQSAIIDYYDTRNPLFVNEKYNLLDGRKEYDKWKARISQAHVRGDYLSEYMIICGMRDFLKGVKWLYAIEPDKYHVVITRPRRFLKIRNKFLWRLCAIKFKKKYLK